MSIPINHHYVSQCQVRNFFNYSERKIYLYDKVLKNYFSRQSTKRVFSEYEANSRITDNQIDHSSLENDLKDNFEDSYTKNFEIISKCIETKAEIADIKNSLIELTKYGIAGEIRPPESKKRVDEVINNFLFKMILPYAAPKLKKELEELKAKNDRTRYTNTIQYSQFVESIFNTIGDINCILFVIKCDHFFIIPDRPSITSRKKINEYFNPDIEEIAIIGIPLSSKIFLYSESTKSRQYEDRIIELSERNISTIEEINHMLYDYAYKQVACENKNYLANFISRIE